MSRIKIEQVNEYYNVELIGVFPDEVCTLTYDVILHAIDKLIKEEN